MAATPSNSRAEVGGKLVRRLPSAFLSSRDPVDLVATHLTGRLLRGGDRGCFTAVADDAILQGAGSGVDPGSEAGGTPYVTAPEVAAPQSLGSSARGLPSDARPDGSDGQGTFARPAGPPDGRCSHTDAATGSADSMEADGPVVPSSLPAVSLSADRGTLDTCGVHLERCREGGGGKGPVGRTRLTEPASRTVGRGGGRRGWLLRDACPPLPQGVALTDQTRGTPGDWWA